MEENNISNLPEKEPKPSKRDRIKKRLNWFLNSKLAVWGTKIASQRHIAALRNGLVANTGFLVVGAFFMIIQQFPVDAWSGEEGLLSKHLWLNNLIGLPKKLTFDTMSFWTSGLIAYNLAKGYKLNPLFPMIASTGAFLSLIPLYAGNADDFYSEWWQTKQIPFGGYAGTNGILLAILVAILVTEFFRFCSVKNIKIPMPSAVPPAVADSFSAMIPITILFVIMSLLRWGFGATPYHYLPVIMEQFLAKPISGKFINQLSGIMTVTFLQSFGWCFGINSGAINGVVRPFWMDLIVSNQDAWADYNKTGIFEWSRFNIGIEDFYNYVTIGGAGSTMTIVFFMSVFGRSEKLKTIARVSLIPAIFNINEPFLFGIPVVLNPIMWAPLILAPLISSIVAYVAMITHVVQPPIGLMNPWTLPIGVLGYLTNFHYSGALLHVFNACLAGFVWFPFAKFYDYQEFRSENNMTEGSILATFKLAKQQGILPPLFNFTDVHKQSKKVNDEINVIKMDIKRLEEGKEKFGLDLKIKKLKNKLRDIKLGDFDGKKFEIKEPIINEKILKITNKIDEKQKAAIVEKQIELNELQGWYDFWLSYEHVGSDLHDLKLKNIGDLQRQKFLNKSIKNKEETTKLINEIRKEYKNSKINIYNEALNNDVYPSKEKVKIYKLELINNNPNVNSQKLEKNNEKIISLKNKYESKLQVKINNLHRKG